MKNKPAKKRCPHCPERCFCGNTEDLENNHLGGRKHVPWLTLPFCKKDHATFHRMCERAGVDFRKTGNKSIGLVQAFKAISIGLWMVLESLEQELIEANDEATK